MHKNKILESLLSKSRDEFRKFFAYELSFQANSYDPHSRAQARSILGGIHCPKSLLFAQSALNGDDLALDLLSFLIKDQKTLLPQLKSTAFILSEAHKLKLVRVYYEDILQNKKSDLGSSELVPIINSIHPSNASIIIGELLLISKECNNYSIKIAATNLLFSQTQDF